MNILITGIAGLLGSRLAGYIVENTENRVIGIDDLSGGYIENIPKDPRITNYRCNLSIDSVEYIFEKEKIDYVYHFAAYAAEGLSPFIRKYNYSNNLISTTNIVNCCIKYNVKRLVFSSSMSVYGHGPKGIERFDEDLVPCPIDPYGVAKYASEMDVRIAGEQHKLDWCIIRPHNVYGRNQNIWDKYRNVLGIWMYQSLNNIPTTIFGDGEQERAFSYIDDILEPLYRASFIPEASKQIINLGGIYSVTINEANGLVRKITGNPEVIHLESRHEVKHAVPTYEKSIKILGYKQKTGLEEGLEKMWKWAKEQPMRDRFIWSEFELDTGIYKFWK